MHEAVTNKISDRTKTHKPEGEHALSNRARPKQGKGIKPRKISTNERL